MAPLSVTTSSAATLTLATTSQAYAFTGSVAATWTLPAVSGSTGIQALLHSRPTASAA